MVNGTFSLELDPVFVIPTCRLRDVPKTVEAYDQNFHDYERKLDILVFDDSPLALHKRYYNLLEKMPTFNDVYYIGPREKEKFLDYIIKRTGIVMADSVINKIFRPSYGGNRNFTLAYTIGRKFISSDDDMRPYGYVTKEQSTLENNEILKARIVKDSETLEKVQNDVAGAFLTILGEQSSTIYLPYGEYAKDPHYDLFTNTVNNSSKNVDKATESVVSLEPLKTSIDDTKIALAQSFRSGTSDMDSIELLYLSLDSEKDNPGSVSDIYAISAFKPFITKTNWRFDCGVSGYDNTKGLPPFFPTTYRFEDYVYRLWSTKKDVATAHVNCIQHHDRNQYMRQSIAYDIFNETIANFLKENLYKTLDGTSDYKISFSYDGRVNQKMTDEILDEIKGLDSYIQEIERKEKNPEKKQSLNEMRNNLRFVFYHYNSDMFFRNFSAAVDEEMYTIKDAMAYWQNILEMSWFMTKMDMLPSTKVSNKRK
ncbi:MAG: hypothetical protein HZB67_05510 [Candidatus Aenigmarchaeota archaeon]|nr:hypothetical protein [Candidatus Aenigmarchaeota archaeon]